MNWLLDYFLSYPLQKKFNLFIICMLNKFFAYYLAKQIVKFFIKIFHYSRKNIWVHIKTMSTSFINIIIISSYKNLSIDAALGQN